MDLFPPLNMAFWSFAQIFFICELGTRISDRYDKIYRETFRYNWYIFPMKIQKCLPILMHGTQQPVVISGFENNQCNRVIIQKGKDKINMHEMCNNHL